jgi:hypothetical protein
MSSFNGSITKKETTIKMVGRTKHQAIKNPPGMLT